MKVVGSGSRGSKGRKCSKGSKCSRNGGGGRSSSSSSSSSSRGRGGGGNELGKRVRKAPEIFDPSAIASAPPKDGDAPRRKRQKNVAADGDGDGAQHKWKKYASRVKASLSRLVRDSHFVEVLTQQKRDRSGGSSSSSSGGPSTLLVDEVARCLQRITAAKLAILQTFEELAAENAGDRAWPELAEDADADGMVRRQILLPPSLPPPSFTLHVHNPTPSLALCRRCRWTTSCAASAGATTAKTTTCCCATAPAATAPTTRY
jgi:hypothetical protein